MEEGARLIYAFNREHEKASDFTHSFYVLLRRMLYGSTCFVFFQHFVSLVLFVSVVCAYSSWVCSRVVAVVRSGSLVISASGGCIVASLVKSVLVVYSGRTAVDMHEYE